MPTKDKSRNGIRDKRIDAYITRSADFAKPILKHLREIVHKGCPEIVETIKWGMPSFDYKGPFCSMAAFKEHAVFGFWKYVLMNDPKNYLGERKNRGGEAMGNLGRITSLKDLPPDKVIIDFIKQAKKFNDDGIKLPAKPKKEKVELVIPDYFINALKKNKKALTVFENFSYSHKKDYLEWVTEAKTEETRNKRIATAVEWISEGKGRNWKYERK
ncbi:MAG: YdeI/OmpD-associated family protein [Ignavibacteriales bacterium]|nr:YdeI/OmpD-associated family protein [Ignavibacteriales bacterium]